MIFRKSFFIFPYNWRKRVPISFKLNLFLFICTFIGTFFTIRSLNNILLEDDHFVSFFFFFLYLLGHQIGVSLLNELLLSILQQVEEVINGKEDSDEIDEHVANGVKFGAKISEASLHHDESPGQGHRNYQVDNLPKNHIYFFPFDELPYDITLSQTQAQIVHQIYHNYVAHQDSKCDSLTRKDIRSNSKVQSPLAAYFLICQTF
jgi:hypothetical protein